MVKKGYKICSYCAEEIKEKAIKCRYCQSILDPSAFAAVEGMKDTPRNEAEKIIAKDISNRMLYFPDLPEEGERRNLTIVFADICGYTPLSEQLDPEDLRYIMDDCYTAMAEVIQKYEGTIDKFIGDAVMVLFGAPIAHGDDPERAQRAALDLIKVIRQVGEKHKVDLALSVGINSGEVVVGGVGAKEKMDFTAIGDAVNTASRLESAADINQIFVSKSVYRQTKGIFEVSPLKRLKVKGKAQPIPVYEVVKAVRTPQERFMGARIQLTPLVGRKGEINKIQSCLDDTKEGKGTIVILTGEAGVGKSRLIYEACRLRPKTPVYFGRCVSYGKNTPYLPFIDLVKNVFEITDDHSQQDMKDIIARKVPKIYARLTPFIPFLEHLLSIQNKAVLELTPKQRAERIHSAIYSLLRGLSRKKPVMIVMEDLHWADPASLELVAYLAKFIPAMPIVMVCVARPYLKMELPSGCNAKRIAVKELSEKQSSTLLDKILTVRNIPKNLKEAVLKKSEGNPFYVEEVVLSLLDIGIIRKKGDKYIFVEDVEEIEIPDTIQGVVLARIDRLGMRMRQVLQCASVIGQDFRYRVLEYVTRLEEDLHQYLSRLVNIEMLLEKTAIEELEYLFRHLVTQEVTYNTLLRRKRMYFHERVAETIEELYHDRLNEHYESIAHHYYLSENSAKAVDYLVKAGDKCKELFANESAIDFYSKLLEILDKKKQKRTEQDKKMKASVLIRRATVSALIGQVKQAYEDCQQALALAEKLKDESLISQSKFELGKVMRIQGKFNEALGLEREALESWTESNDVSQQVNALNAIGVICWNLGEYSDALEHFEQMKDLCEDVGNLRLFADAHNNVGLVYWNLGDYDRALKCLTKAHGIRKETLDKQGEVDCLNNIGIICEKLGFLRKALQNYNMSINLANKIGYRMGQTAGLVNMGQAKVLLGKYREAISCYRKALDSAKQSSDAHAEAMCMGNLGQCLVQVKDFENAQDYLAKAKTLSKKNNDFDSLINSMIGFGELYLHTGELDKAKNTAKIALKECKQHSNFDNVEALEKILEKIG